MKILVLNCGSSSLKFQVIETSAEQIAHNEDRLLGKGMVEKIGSGEAVVSFQTPDGKKTKFGKSISEHKAALEAAFGCLMGPDGIIQSEREIEGVGHRVVHGGERFFHSALINDDVIREIEQCIDLAPLHNPPNLKGYYASRALLKQALHVAVFDTAFHHSMPPKSYLYAIPYMHYSRDQIRRYGFHGTSHRYVSYRYAQLHGKTRAAFKLITVHLGNGCSICAIDHGHVMETSMGFTPLEGLVMGTRGGDIDAGVVLHLLTKREMGVHEMETMLNRHSGLLGISGISNDMRDLVRASERGDDRARLAIDMFCHRVKKYIGSYYAVLNGVDALIFTGGIGENAPNIRSQICDRMGALGIALDPDRNTDAAGREMRIGLDSAPVQVWVIPTNEELLIARDTLRCIQGLPLP